MTRCDGARSPGRSSSSTDSDDDADDAARGRTARAVGSAAMANVEISQPADGVTQLTLNRPKKLNALTYELVSELHAALDAVDRDHSCRVVILTGAGRGF